MKMVAPLEPAIVCFDMERMLRFYVDILGLRLVSDIQATPEIGKAIHISQHGYRIVRLQTPYGSDQVDLLERSSEPASRLRLRL